jgi:hypothetical protein
VSAFNARIVAVVDSCRTACRPSRAAPSTLWNIVDERGFGRSDAQPFARQRIDRRVRLGKPNLVGVDDVVDEVGERVATGLFAPGTVGGVAHYPGLEPGSKTSDVRHQLFIKLTAVPVLYVDHQLIDLSRRQPKHLGIGGPHLSLAEPADLREPLGIDLGDRGVKLRLSETQPPAPGVGPQRWTHALKHAADVEENSTDRHA